MTVLRRNFFDWISHWLTLETAFMQRKRLATVLEVVASKNVCRDLKKKNENVKKWDENITLLHVHYKHYNYTKEGDINPTTELLQMICYERLGYFFNCCSKVLCKAVGHWCLDIWSRVQRTTMTTETSSHSQKVMGSSQESKELSCTLIEWEVSHVKRDRIRDLVWFQKSLEWRLEAVAWVRLGI